MPDIEITQEELQAELEAMKASGTSYAPTKKINRKVNSYKNARKILIVVLASTILLCLFVWFSSLYESLEGNGYIIKIRDTSELYGETEQESLKLAFDPKFKEEYMNLVGLGYDEVSDFRGGSLLSSVEMNTTMFDKFQNLVEHKEVADVYEKNEGSANFDQYYANKYYLKNTGKETIEYRLNIEVTANRNDALDAARFMIVTGTPDKGFDYSIYATANKETKKGEIAAYKDVRTAEALLEYFKNPNLKDENPTSTNIEDAWICQNLKKDKETGYYHYYSCERDSKGKVTEGKMYKLKPGESVCYTICVWFEGSDPDHNNSIMGGGIEFSINYETEGYLKALYELKQQNNK